MTTVALDPREKRRPRDRRSGWRRSVSFLRVAAPLFASLDCGTVGVEDHRASSGHPLAVHWLVDNVSSVGGYPAKRAGAPLVTEDAGRRRLCFGGQEDALVLPVNPLAEQSAFSVQISFKSSPGGGRTQTVLHIEDYLGDARLLVELHASKEGLWRPRLTVRNKIDQVKLEPSTDVRRETWHWLGVTFGEGVIRLFLDGREVGASPMSLIPMNRGNLALAAKLNLEGWFKGCLGEVRFANGALRPGELATTTAAAN
jgi:Concanavalin A-like lectin/glucanases superfamily